MTTVDWESRPWKKPNPNRVYTRRAVWVHYGHPDLEKAHEFLVNFGFTESHRTSNPERIFYRGYNDQPVLYISERTAAPCFFGGALEAASVEDLERASKIEGAGPIRDCEFPGGGKIVSIRDPDGVLFNIVHGYKTVEPGPPPQGAREYNKPALVEGTKARKGSYQRIPPGPSPIYKLGHFGHTSADLGRISAWYMKNFNLRSIDIQADPFDPTKSKDLSVFYCIDLGEEYVDHHTFFHFKLFPGQKYFGTHHSSFEVHDFDIQLQGHYHLQKQNYNLMRGVGRHLLGSQIFDYWYDTDGFVVEHYADGDVVNNENKPERYTLELEEYTIWGGAINSKGGFRGDSRA